MSPTAPSPLGVRATGLGVRDRTRLPHRRIVASCPDEASSHEQQRTCVPHQPGAVRLHHRAVLDAEFFQHPPHDPEELGVEYRTVVQAYGTGMKSAEYLAVNPMGKVPALQHRGVVVTEAAAICAYLADAFPQAGLAPEIGRAHV